MPAYIQRPDGSALYFDLTDEERHAGIAEVTKFPVEDGPEVTDHIRPMPAPLVLRCTISNTPLVPSGNQPGTDVQGNVAVDASPYKPEFSAAAAVVGAAVNPIGTVINAIKGALSDDNHIISMPVLMFSKDFNAPVDTLFTLDDIKDKGELLTVFTSIAEYDDVVLTKFEIIRNAGTGTGAEVELHFEPLNIVTTSTAAAPQPSEPRGSAVKKKGAQGPKQPEAPKDGIVWSEHHK